MLQLLELCMHFISTLQHWPRYSLSAQCFLEMAPGGGEFPAVKSLGDCGSQQLEVCVQPRKLHCDSCSVPRENCVVISSCRVENSFLKLSQSSVFPAYALCPCVWSLTAVLDVKYPISNKSVHLQSCFAVFLPLLPPSCCLETDLGSPTVFNKRKPHLNGNCWSTAQLPD